MKKNSASRFFGIAAAALAVLFCFVACDKKPIGGGGTILPPDDEDPHVIELYIVTPPVKTKYRAGEMFDSTGMTLAAKWSHLDDDGNHIIEDLSPDECEINPDGALDSKDKNITFIYEGASVGCVPYRDVGRGNRGRDFRCVVASQDATSRHDRSCRGH